MEEAKICTKCKTAKPNTLEYYALSTPPSNDKPGTLYSACRECRNAACREWGKKDRLKKAKIKLEKLKKIQESGLRLCTKCQQWLPANTDTFYHRNVPTFGLSSHCKNCIKSAASRHLSKNGDRINDVRRKKRKDNPEIYRQRENRYNNAHKPQRAKYGQLYRMQHRDEAKQRRRNYRAMSHHAEGYFTKDQLHQQYLHQKGRCYYCNKQVGNYSNQDKTWHADHVVPLSRGGTNWISNIVIACVHCNTSKRNKLPHEWPEGNRLL